MLCTDIFRFVVGLLTLSLGLDVCLHAMYMLFTARCHINTVPPLLLTAVHFAFVLHISVSGDMCMLFSPYVGLQMLYHCVVSFRLSG